MTSYEDPSSAIQKIEKVGSGVPTDSLDLNQQPRLSPDKEKFDSLMDQKQEGAIKVLEKEGVAQNSPSLMDQLRELGQKADQVTKVSSKDLADQTNKLIAEIEQVKQKLSNQNGEINSSYKSLLKNKLSHIDENIRIALSRAGLEYTPPAPNQGVAKTSIDRFLSFLTDGETKLRTLGTEVEAMHLSNKDLNPASMLMIQLKVGYIQQELEFFTSVLNKALESTKTIMNVQV